MKKGRSYTELMKSGQKNQQSQPEKVNIYVEMLLDEILFIARMNSLKREIDFALDNHDKISFQRLSKEYERHMRHA
jgi:uncharacterized protein YpiB (UPF0302 family)